ncbi:MAG: hypothetical protein CSA74_02040 [Rhodobacterales bacterium]|nr:MAG: hypothetical protein CSA74_02040 [Rhodobacterales bacterium]
MSILKAHVEAGDRIAYYTALDSFGVAYGGLALGVVLNNSISGASANGFLVAQGLDGVANTDLLARIGTELMEADYDARKAANGADLEGTVISNYHQRVFEKLAGAGPEAWTPYIYLDTFDSPEAFNAAWEELVGAGNVETWELISDRLDQQVDAYHEAHPETANYGVWMLRLLNREFLVTLGFDAGFVDWFKMYDQYLGDLRAAGAVGFVTGFFPRYFSNRYGNYDIANGSGRIIGGDAGSDELSGGSGDDIVMGFSGNDVIAGSAGDDRIYGNGGTDTVDYSGETDPVRIEVGTLQDDRIAHIFGPMVEDWNIQCVVSENGTDILVNIERITATAGDDTLILAGNLEDILQDYALTYGGIELGDQGDAGDTIDLSLLLGSANVFMFGNGITQIRDGQGMNEGDALFFGAENIIGTAFYDNIQGDEVDNIIVGGDGDDRIDGGDGDDIIVGGNGADTIDGGDGFDTMVFSAVNGPVVVNLAQGVGQQGEAAGDSYESMEVFIGTDGSDTFYSGNGTSYLAGGDGNDTFHVAARDSDSPVVVWGGAGADVVELDRFDATIMTVEVGNLGKDNFNTFHVEDLGLGSLSDVDVIVLNPDDSDRFIYSSPTSTHSATLGVTGGWYMVEIRQKDEDDNWVLQEFGPIPGVINSTNTISGSEHSAAIGSLSSSYHSMFGAFPVHVGYQVRDPLTGEYVDQDYWWEDVFDPDAAAFSFESEEIWGPDADGAGGTYYVWVEHQIDPHSGWWTIFGGSFSGNSLSADGTVSITLEDAEPLPGSDATGAQPLSTGNKDAIVRCGVVNDKVWGKAGSDTFVFRAGDGADRSTGFDPANDRIGLTATMLDNGDLTIPDDPAGAEIAQAPGDTILLQTALAAEITEAQFLFA